MENTRGQRRWEQHSIIRHTYTRMKVWINTSWRTDIVSSVKDIRALKQPIAESESLGVEPRASCSIKTEGCVQA